MYRYFFIFFIFFSFLISPLNVSQAQKPISTKDPISAVKPLSTLNPLTAVKLPAAILKKAYTYQISTKKTKSVYCKMFSGRMPPGLTLNTSGLISGIPSRSGNFLFGISITDSHKQAIKQTFSLKVKASPVPTNATPNTRSKKRPVITNTPTPNLKVINVSLFFGDNTTETAMSSKTKDLRAYAVVRFKGSGWLKGYWQINGKTISLIKEYLDPTAAAKQKLPETWAFSSGSKKRLPDMLSKKPALPKATTSPTSKSPSHPDGVKGKDMALTNRSLKSDDTYIISSPVIPTRSLPEKSHHSLNFVITSPAQKMLSAKATYSVSRSTNSSTPPVRLMAPGDDSEIEFMPTTFNWKNPDDNNTYAIYFLDEDTKEVILSADTTTPEYCLKPSEYKDIFSPGKNYNWRVSVYDKDKNILGQSPAYRFKFLPSATHVTGQILLVLKDPGKARYRIELLSKKYNLRLEKSRAIRSLRQTMAVFSTQEDIYTVIKAVKKEKYVVSAQPNNIFRTMAEPMTGMQNIYHICYLNKLHERYTGKRVTVGIVDTGVDTYHRDLKERITAHENYVENSRYRAEVHGTAVAGIIGAGINGFGITGVAPEVKILALRACKQVSDTHPEGRCRTDAIIQALDAAIEMNADIVNMSFGASVGDMLLRRLIDEGVRRGMIFVAPVGNRVDQETLWFPASHKNVIAVAGTDETGNPFPNAEIAARADVCAPSSNLFTTVPGQKHNFLNGTSMSSAVVSGLLALARGKNGRLKASQLPDFNGNFCMWEQKLIQIPLCEE